MPRVLDLVEMPGGRLGVVLDMPTEARSSVSLWTAAEHDRAIARAVRAEREAIVAFIDRHKKQRVLADSNWDEGYEAALDNIAAGIKARGEILAISLSVCALTPLTCRLRWLSMRLPRSKGCDRRCKS
jgi:hypothetical protein